VYVFHRKCVCHAGLRDDPELVTCICIDIMCVYIHVINIDADAGLRDDPELVACVCVCIHIHIHIHVNAYTCLTT